MKRSEKILLVIFFILVVLIAFLFYQYLNINQRNKKTTPLITEFSPTPTPQTVRKPEDLPLVKKDEETGKEIIEIPFNYLVKSIDQEKIVLQKPDGGELDIITYPKDLFSVIKVFKSSATGTTATTLSDVAVGQSIKVRNINRGEEIQFFILQP